MARNMLVSLLLASSALVAALPAVPRDVYVTDTVTVDCSTPAGGASASATSGPDTTASAPLYISTPHDLDGFVPVNPDAIPPTPKNGYNFTGNLTKPEPRPYTPAGGLGTDPNVPPIYNPMSDFDAFSLSLGLYQEWIELDLFHNGLARFSVADFEAAGLTAADRFLIEWMADRKSQKLPTHFSVST
jgi:hypothetical protein